MKTEPILIFIVCYATWQAIYHAVGRRVFYSLCCAGVAAFFTYQLSLLS